jgi:sodium/potassium/calcium exchanger 6
MFLGPIPLVVIVEGIGLILGVVIFFTSTNEKPRLGHVVVLLMIGFVLSIIWIYMIANEIVSLLKVLGDIVNISQAILGITVLAWGNSVSGKQILIFSESQTSLLI